MAVQGTAVSYLYLPSLFALFYLGVCTYPMSYENVYLRLAHLSASRSVADQSWNSLFGLSLLGFFLCDVTGF